MLLLLLALVAQDTSVSVRVAVAPAESLAVTQVGDGAPVVMIPGLLGSSYGYRHVMIRLERDGYWSVGIEPLGMGLSSLPEEADYSLTAQADRVAAVLDSLSIEDAVIVGHSIGASIAMRLAYRHPGLVRGIVSIEGGPGETATSDAFRRWMRFAPIAGMINGRGIIQHMLYKEMKSVSFDDSWVDKQVVLAYTKGLDEDYRATIKAFRRMAKSPEPERLSDHLGAITCPVVLLVGDTEHDSGPSSAEVTLLTTELSSFAVDTVSRSGSFIQEEQPGAVADAVGRIQRSDDCGDQQEL